MYSFKFHKPGYVFLGLCVGLAIFGLFVLASASAPIAISKFGDAYHFVKRQFLFGIIPGIFLLILLLKFDYRKLKILRWVFWVVMNALLILPFIPGIGTDFGKADSWVAIGSFTFQPSEFAKILFILFAASFIEEITARETITTAKSFFKYVVAFGLPALLIILQPDIGTLAALFIIAFAMLFIAGARIKHLALLAGSAIVGLAVIVLKAPYRAQRLITFLHPELDPQGVGYHINQAFLAIGSGGLFGLGFGNSRQKFQYLPEVAADSIFAIIGEELGFIFAAGLVIVFFYLFYRGLKIAKQAPDIFGKILVYGVIIWITFQAFLNIGAMVGLLPLTGLPLPFISHGGSALLSLFIAIGLVGAVSRRTIE